MKMVTRMLEEELYEAVTEDGVKTTIDMRALPHKRHQSPVEMILSSLSACGAIDIVVMLRKRKKTVESFTIEAEGQRRTETPRAFTSIHCTYIVTSPDVTE